MYTHAYMYTHVLLQHYAADFSLLHKLKIFIYMSDRPQGTDLTLVFSLSSFSIFFPLPSISVRSFSSPKQTSVSSMFSSSVRSFSSLPCHATFPTHDTVDKDTVEMDIVAMDIDMDVADMDLVVLGNTTGPLVHYWVRDAKCTWSSYENSYKFENTFLKNGRNDNWELNFIWQLHFGSKYLHWASEASQGGHI